MCEPREVGLNVDDEKNDETRKENRTDDEDFRRFAPESRAAQIVALFFH